MVISIIALLVSILMPALSKARQKSKAVVCLSQLRQWGAITAMYCQDNDDKLYQSDTVAGASREEIKQAYWVVASLPYYQNKEIRKCPSTKEINRAAGYHYGKTDEMWGPLPSSLAWAEEFSTGSYGINEWCACPPGNSIWGFSSNATWKNSSVRNGSEIPVFLDSKFVDGFVKETDLPPTTLEEHNGWGSNGIRMFCIPRHGIGVNAVFLDGSAHFVELKKLWQLRWHKSYKINNAWTKTDAVWPDWMSRIK
ncbi:MAG: hypothetical protein JEZ07_18445 [Phycisphaerae bacterium]|nr:hypothetical protein [Phycisphaerae bacterium]